MGHPMSMSRSLAVLLPLVVAGIALHPAERLAVSARQDETGRAPRAAARDLHRRALALADVDEALALLWTASGLAPGDADIQIALAEGLERVGALDAAIETWRAALAARPADRKAARGLVLALVAVGRGPEAVTLARTAAEAAPKDSETVLTLGLAQSEQDVEAALATLQTVLDRAPDHTLARYNLALLLRRVDRLDEAVTELIRVLARDPRAEAHYALGLTWWHRGEAARATASFEAAIAMEPRYAEAYHKLGVVKAAQRDWAAAQAALQPVVSSRYRLRSRSP